METLQLIFAFEQEETENVDWRRLQKQQVYEMRLNKQIHQQGLPPG